MTKILIVGLDGGSPELIGKWRDELPNLNRLIRNGVFGSLESSIPPVTSPAWDCMFTGKNPGKLGIFDFIVLPEGDGSVPKIRGGANSEVRYLWDFLGDRGTKVAILGVPNTYPARPVNGIMVSGGLLTILAKDYTYPATIREELDRAVEGYEIFPLTDLDISGREQEYIEEYNRILDKQAKAAKYLMQRYPWELFICVFFDIDSVQHYLWAHMDRKHPRWTEEKGKEHGDAIKNFYQRVDGAIGVLTKDLPPETIVMVVSDHGGGPLHGDFCINEWFRQKGLLSLRRTGHGRLTQVLSLKKGSAFVKRVVLKRFDPRTVEHLLRMVPGVVLEKFTLRYEWKDSVQQLFDSIDWLRTKAYGLPLQSVFINTKKAIGGIVEPGEEYEEVRNQIIQALYEIRDPRTGGRAVDRVLKREEIYNGDYVDKGPDLINWMGDLKSGAITYRQSTEVTPGRLWTDSPISGHHNLYGVLIVSGPFIRKGETIGGAKIYDITPTVLHILGAPIPADMDGRVLPMIFEPESVLGKQPVMVQETSEKEKILMRVRELKHQGKL